MRILVKRYIAIGDVLWTTPVIAALARRHPGARVEVSTARPEVFRGNPDVAAVHAPFCDEGGFDRVIDLNGAYERRRDLHMLAAYAAAAGVRPTALRPSIHPDAEDFAFAAAALRPLASQGVERIVAVHMAATSPDRIWPIGHWQAFLNTLLGDRTVGVVALGSGKDIGLGADGGPARIVDLVRRASLHQTAAILGLADVMIGPDSGVGHIAAAMGTRSVILHGMTDPRIYMPLGGTGEAVWSPVECRGCIAALPPEAPPLCRLEKSVCYEAIAPETVLEATRRALTAAVSGPEWRQRLPIAAG